MYFDEADWKKIKGVEKVFCIIEEKEDSVENIEGLIVPIVKENYNIVSVTKDDVERFYEEHEFLRFIPNTDHKSLVRMVFKKKGIIS